MYMVRVSSSDEPEYVDADVYYADPTTELTTFWIGLNAVKTIPTEKITNIIWQPSKARHSALRCADKENGLCIG